MAQAEKKTIPDLTVEEIEPPMERVRTTLTDEERKERAQQVIEAAQKWRPVEANDDVRAPHSSSYGGFGLTDDAAIQRMRSAAGLLVQKAGQKILSGDFNLTRISFPIQCMSHKSALETCSSLASTMPSYFNCAASIDDPLERFKLAIGQMFSYQMYEKFYDKPLNPILGETFQIEGKDGSQCYFEQTSHHPPVTSYLIEGPDNNYNVSGYLEFSISSGLTSATVNCKGHKTLKFKDGQVIKWTHNDDSIYGLFMGSIGHQLIGKVHFVDEANEFTAHVDFGAYYTKKQDYCWGEIFVKGQKKCEIVANYMGFCDIDGVRYWDYRDKKRTHFALDYELPPEQSLPSQSTKRTDGIYLQTKTIEEAQEEKERLEELQRSDRKNREKAAKRRADGGPKYPE